MNVQDEELANAQQDRIDKHKELSFTESSMQQLTESQKLLQDDNQKLNNEITSFRVSTPNTTANILIVSKCFSMVLVVKCLQTISIIINEGILAGQL